MTAITAALVKELRERTNAGMMECKKALVEANGDIDKAIEAMRVAGQAKAVKKASRATAEGTISVLSSADAKIGILIEINCETDFVAREEKFKQFVKSVGATALQQKITTLEALQKAMEQSRLELVAQLGENVMIRRYVYHTTTEPEGVIGTYAHGDANGVRIGALVVMKKGSQELAKDLAMQVAAMNPEYLTATDIPQARLEKEKEILLAQTRENDKDKPADMLEKIVGGKLKKFATEISLMGQSYVKEPKKTVEALLKENNAVVALFVRFEVGEGVDKQEDNFVQEVMAQVRGE